MNIPQTRNNLPKFDPKTGRYNPDIKFRLPPEAYNAIVAMAKDEDRSLPNLVARIVRLYLRDCGVYREEVMP